MAEPDRILRIRTVLQRMGLSRLTLFGETQEGSFPRRAPISIHGAGWRALAINPWIADPVAFQADVGGEGL